MKMRFFITRLVQVFVITTVCGTNLRAAPIITPAIQKNVANMYIALLGRNPDTEGFGYWTNSLAEAGNSGAAQNAVVVGFSNSPEFVATYGNKTTAQAVSAMYENILGRAPDAAGLVYWQAEISSLTASGKKVAEAYAQVAYQIITNATANPGAPGFDFVAKKQTAAIAAAVAVAPITSLPSAVPSAVVEAISASVNIPVNSAVSGAASTVSSTTPAVGSSFSSPP